MQVKSLLRELISREDETFQAGCLSRLRRVKNLTMLRRLKTVEEGWLLKLLKGNRS